MKRGFKFLSLIFICFIFLIAFSNRGYNASQLNLKVQRGSDGVLLITENSIGISWDYIGNASYYKVEVTDGSSFHFLSEAFISNTYKIDNLSPSTVYKITVTAYNSTNNLISSEFIYAITQFSLFAKAKEEFPVPQGSGGEQPKIDIGFDKITNNFTDDFEFKGYNVFVSKKMDKSDANQYFVDANTLSLYKYQLINNNKVLINLVKDSVYQSAYEENSHISFTLYDQYDGITSKELKPGTMYYIYLEPNIELHNNVIYYYKPVDNEPCPTLIQISAAKVAEVENNMGVLGALVRVQWAGVDPGEYKQDEIQYRAYYATNEADLKPWGNWPDKEMFATTSYLQNEAFIPWLSTNVDFYYIRVEAIFADGKMRIPSQLIKISVNELQSVPSTIQNCKAEPLSKNQIEISFRKPLLDDSFLRYQIWYSEKYEDKFNEFYDPVEYKPLHEQIIINNKDVGGFEPKDLTLSSDGKFYSYVVSDLKPNTVYYFKIRAVNSQTYERSDFSLVFVGTTKKDDVILINPVGNAYLEANENSITARIDQVDLSDIKGAVYGVYYQVYIAEQNFDIGSFKYLFEVSKDDLSQNQNLIAISQDANGQPIKSNTSYYLRFKVRVNVDGIDYFSEFSKAFVVLTKPSGITIPEKSRPQIPRNFMISDRDGALTQTSVEIRWDMSPNQSYVIMRTQKPIDDIKWTVAETVYYAVYTLKQKVEIYAKDSSGNFVLKEVLSNPSNTNAPIFAAIFEGATSPFSDKNLNPNTLYYYSIKAIEDSRESFWGSLAVTTQTIEPPTNLMILSRLSDGHGIALQWLGNPDFGYQVFVQKEGDSSFSLVFSGKLTPTSLISPTKAQFSYTVFGLKSNTLYYFKVRSVHLSSGKVSSPTDIVAARTLFNQNDFDEQQRNQQAQDEDNIRIIQMQKQITTVLENSYERYYLYINTDNAINEIEKASVNEFVIDFTKATYNTAKGEVVLSYKVFDRLQALQKDMIVRYYNTTIRIPPGALNVDEVNRISQKYGIDKGYVTVCMQIGYLGNSFVPWGYRYDSQPVYFIATARFYSADESVISQFAKPITYILKSNNQIEFAKSKKVVYDYKNYTEIENALYDPASNQMYMNLQTTGAFGILIKDISSTLDMSRYKDDIVYIIKKYNQTDLYNNPLKPLSFDYAKMLIRNIFKVDVDNIASSSLKRQEAVYLLAKVYEQKKNTSVDSILITKSSKFDIEQLYKKYYLAMLSIGVVDIEQDPSRTIDVDEFVHYVANLDRILNN